MPTGLLRDFGHFLEAVSFRFIHIKSSLISVALDILLLLGILRLLTRFYLLWRPSATVAEINERVPFILSLIAIGIALLLAFFLAWRDEHHAKQQIEQEKSALQEQLKKETPLEQAIALLSRPTQEDRVQALNTIKQLNSPETRKVLREKLLSHPNFEVRAEIACYLGEFRDCEAAPYLIERLNDSSVEVKRSATWALSQTPNILVLPYAILHLSDEDMAVCRHLIRILVQFPDTRSITALLEVLANHDKCEYVRSDAAKALVEIVSTFHAEIKPGDDTYYRILGGLLNATNDEVPRVRYWAIKTVGIFRDPQTVQTLEGLLDDKTTVPDLMGSIGEIAAEALRNIGTEKVKEVLEKWESRKNANS